MLRNRLLKENVRDKSGEETGQNKNEIQQKSQNTTIIPFDNSPPQEASYLHSLNRKDLIFQNFSLNDETKSIDPILSRAEDQDTLIQQMKGNQSPNNTHNIYNPSMRESNDAYKKIIEQDQCTSKQMITALQSPNLSQLSIPISKKGINLMDQDIKFVFPKGGSLRVFPESQFTHLNTETLQQNENELKSDNEKTPFTTSQYATMSSQKPSFRKQQSLQLHPSFSVKGVNYPKVGDINNQRDHQPNNLRTENNYSQKGEAGNLLQLSFIKQRLGLQRKSGSNDSTPKSGLMRKNSIMKSSQLINTLNFTNAMMDNSMNNINNSAFLKASNLYQQSSMSLLSSPKNNNVNTNTAIMGGKSQWNSALKIIYVQRFKKKMMSLISHRMKPTLNQVQYNLLNDKSHFTDIKPKSLIQSSLFNCCSLMLLKIPLSSYMEKLITYLSHVESIQPNSFQLIVWKSFFILVSIVCVYYYSLKAAFDIGISDTVSDSVGLAILFNFLNIIFPIDMLIDLNTGFYQEGVVQHNRIKIILRNLYFDFWVHGVKIFLQFSTFTSDISTFSSYTLCFLHLYSMSKDFTPLDQHQQIQQKYPVVRLVVLLFIVILTVAHLSGCFFYTLSQFGSDYYIASNKGGSSQDLCNNWVQCQSLENQSWINQYIFSLYFSFITMITVGYGDIFPVSVYEKLYVIGMTCISCGIFGYAINKIGSEINEIAQKQLSQKQEQYEIINYMHNRQITKSTQIKVIKFIEHVQEKEKENPVNGQIILKKVSKSLKQQVQMEYYGSIIKQSKVFQLTFSKAFLDELIVHMNEALFSPEEIIYNSNKSSDRTLYFLVSGRIGKYSNFNQNELKLLRTISKKQFIGLTSFFSEQNDENLVYQTLETSLIVSLHHKDFMKCLSNFPTDLEKYHSIKQSIFETSKRLECCSSCNQYTHNILECNLLHLSLNSYLIKTKYQFSQNQMLRDPTKRRKRYYKEHSWQINKSIKKKVRQLRSNLILESRGHDVLDTTLDTAELEFESDYQFFKRVAQIRMSQNQIVTFSDYNESAVFSNNSIVTSEVSSCSYCSSKSPQFKPKKYSQYLIEETEEEDRMDNIEDNYVQTNQLNKNSRFQAHKSRLSLQIESKDLFHQSKKLHNSHLNFGNTLERITNEELKPQSTKNNIDQNSKHIKKNHQSSDKLTLTSSQYDLLPKKSKSLPKQFHKSLHQNPENLSPLKSQSLPKNQQISESIKYQSQKNQESPLYKRQPSLSSYLSTKKNTEAITQQDTFVDGKQTENNITQNVSQQNTSNKTLYTPQSDLSIKVYRANNRHPDNHFNYTKEQNSSFANTQNETPTHITISFAPSLINKKPNQNISISKHKKQEELKEEIKNKKEENSSLSDESQLSISSHQSVSIDPNKIKSVQPSKKTLKVDSPSKLQSSKSVMYSPDKKQSIPSQQQDDFNYYCELSNQSNNTNGENHQNNENKQNEQISEQVLLSSNQSNGNTNQISRLKKQKSIKFKKAYSRQQEYLESTSQQKPNNYPFDNPVKQTLLHSGSPDEDKRVPHIFKLKENLHKLKTFDQKNDFKKKQTIEVDGGEQDNNFPTKVKMLKRKLDIDLKAYTGKKSSNLHTGNTKERKNNYLQNQLNRKSFKNEQDLPEFSNLANSVILNYQLADFHSKNTANNDYPSVNQQYSKENNFLSPLALQKHHSVIKVVQNSNGPSIPNQINSINSHAMNNSGNIDSSLQKKSSILYQLQNSSNLDSVKLRHSCVVAGSQLPPIINDDNQMIYLGTQTQNNLSDNLFLYDFDLSKEWTYFLPHNNQSIVIKEIKKNQKLQTIKQKTIKSRMQQITRSLMNKKRLGKLSQTLQREEFN